MDRAGVARVAPTIAFAWLIACPGHTPSPRPPAPVDDASLRIRIANAEARRGGGIAELTELARGSHEQRVLALRGLGRIGGPEADAVVTAALADPDPSIAGAAAGALGLAASLDDDPGDPRRTQALLAALARVSGHEPETVQVIEGLGRAADRGGESALVAGLSGAPAIAAASAIALGRFGRRKLELGEAARDALAAATGHPDARVRYAAAYALAREQLSDAARSDAHAAEAARRLASLLDDDDAGVRAQATAALVRRKAVSTGFTDRLHDPDWRVAVEAVRALGGDAADDASREQVAVAALRWELGAESGVRIDYAPNPGPSTIDPARRLLLVAADPKLADALRSAAELHRPGWGLARIAGSPGDVHVVLEGLRMLAPHANQPAIRHVVETIRGTAIASQLPEPARGWIACLAEAALIRGATDPDYGSLTCSLPDHLKLPLIGELVGAKVGSIDRRRAALRPLLAHADPRVRAAGMTALGALWEEGDAADHRATAATLVAALGSDDGLIAGTAVETATTIYDAAAAAKRPDPVTEWRDALDAAVVARAQTEKDPELAGSLFELIGKRAIAAGAPACRAGLGGAPVLAKAAVGCLKALGRPADPPPIAAAKAPPVDVALVIGKRVRWHLETTRGDVTIELAPDAAPWAVATIAMLTRKGFYDGLEVHRVVPDFVVQGGDPTQSGWGGPGFAIPSEPSSGSGFEEGGVGIADAGRDSGGSQWFVMHAAAPHLDGRYTWVGHVVDGQKSADALVIGDRVIRATIELTPRL